jgi:PST family polysaccharide transporter
MKNIIKVKQNIVWLFIDKIVRLLFSLFLLGKVAIYLQADDFGILNYSIALVGLLSPFISLGIDQILVQYLVNPNEKKEEIISSVFYTKVFTSVIILIICVGLGYSNLGYNENFFYVVILSFSLLFIPFDTFDSYYQSLIKSRIPALIRLTIFVFISIVKLYFIVEEKPLLYFVWIILIEGILNYVSVTLFFIINNGLEYLHFKNINIKKIKELIKKSWPLFLSSIAITIYMKIDQIMLGNISLKQLGYYSAAIKLSEIWNLIPVIIIPTVYPILIKSHLENKIIEFNKRVQLLVDTLLLISIFIALITTFLAPWIIEIIYDKTFSRSIITLQIHIWSTIFVFLGTAYSYILLIKDKAIITLYGTILGAVVNIVLNLVLLPMYGSVGASISTLVSYGLVLIYIIFLSNNLYSILYLTSFRKRYQNFEQLFNQLTHAKLFK